MRVFFSAIVGIFTIASLGAVAPTAAQAATPTTVPPLIDNPSEGVTAAPLPTAQINGIAWDQVIVGDTVYAGGQFTSARPAGAALGTDESPRENLMSYSLSTGEMTSWAPSVNGRIRVMAASKDGSRLYIGGAFTSVNGQPRYRIAAFNTNDGSLVPDFAPVVGSDVFGIAVGTDAIYLGGWFGSLNGVTRSRLGAVSLTGETLAWAPTANNTVASLGLTAAEDRVIVSGSFSDLNGTAVQSLSSLDAENGGLYPFAANQVIRNGSWSAAVGSVRVINDKVYATGWAYRSGNFEGMVKVDAYTGAIENFMACSGDTYDAMPFKGSIYTVSHHHRCDPIGGAPQSKRHQFSDAITENITGTTQALFTGQPAGSYVNWFPTWQPATSAVNGSGAFEAGWTTEAAGEYLAIGGEFTAINGIPQQGLSRFGTRNVPNTTNSTPAAPGTEMVPALQNLTSTSTRVTVHSQWDRDNLTLKTKIFRLDVSTKEPVHTFTTDATYWERPDLSWVDTGLTAGQTYTYRVQFEDPDGNKRTSADVSIVAGSDLASLSPYALSVYNAGASNYWPLGEPAGSTTADDIAGDLDLTMYKLTGGTVNQAQAGAIAGSSDTATAFSNAWAAHANAIQAPTTFSEELWFKTTTTAGGKLLGFGEYKATTSNAHDRNIYMTPDGKLNFGVFNGGIYKISSENSYNDGQWHHVVGTMSKAGLSFWVDGLKIGKLESITMGRDYTGFWRIGGDRSWAGGFNFDGTIDDVAIYPKVISRAEIRDHYRKSGRVLNLPADPTDAYGVEVTTDEPTLYWRLNEKNSTTAADTNSNISGTYRNRVIQGQASAVVEEIPRRASMAPTGSSLPTPPSPPLTPSRSRLGSTPPRPPVARSWALVTPRPGSAGALTATCTWSLTAR